MEQASQTLQVLERWNRTGPDTVAVADLDLKQLGLAAANRQIDAFSVWEPHAYKLSSPLGNDATTLKVSPLNVTSAVLLAPRGPTGLAQGEQSRFLRALDKAILFMKAEPKSKRAILQQRLKFEFSEINTIKPNYRFWAYIESVPAVNI